MRGPLNNEVRQSLSLIALTAMTMLVYIGIGILAVHVLG
jgi:hypothetical protein